MTSRRQWLNATAIQPTQVFWGLKNLSQEKWVATLPDRSVIDVDPGEV
jgi:hypothetical protein